MRKIYLVILFLSLWNGSAARAQERGIFFLMADSLEQNGTVSLGRVPWRYHTGDDTRWADTSFNDQSWPLLAPLFDLNSLPADTWQGIGWFRLQLQVDSALLNRTLALQLSHGGASEIYLDGKLLHSFGVVGSYQGQEETFDPKKQPLAIHLNEKTNHLLAVRYSFEKAANIKSKHGSWAGAAGFSIQLSHINQAITGEIDFTRQNTLLNLTLFGILIAFAFLHLLLYIYYARGSENFWYSLFAGSLACFFLCAFLEVNTHYVESAIWYSILRKSVFFLLIFISFVGFLYSVFYQKTPKQFQYIIISGILLCVISIWKGYGANSYTFYLLAAFVLFTTLEVLRIISVAIWKKKSDADIIGRGILGFVLLIGYFLLTSAHLIQFSKPTDIILSYIGFLSIPVSIAMYLARKTARTSHYLEAQVLEVSRLSKQSLRQEVEKYKLIELQKQELKIQVEERTRELQETNRHLNQINEELNVTLENLKSAQQQLVQSEKMASLGQLTAGVAHEINNPINFVSAGIDSLKINYQEIIHLAQLYFALRPEEDNRSQLAQLAKLKQELEVEDLVEESERLFKSIKNGAVRTTEIVKSLRNFTRLDEDALKKADIHEGLDSTLTILHNQLKERIQVVKQYDAVPPINCYPGQLNQVFMNILSNAIQAIQGKGTIWISTRLKQNVAEICIKDSGKGMPEEVRRRVFEPFFTTKDVGEGTGLGLSISYGIIEKHRGNIRVESEPGKGTEFIIQIPLDLQ
jgi:signal transduction histidine kinase